MSNNAEQNVHWKYAATLSALKISGNSWDHVMFAGGSQAVVENNKLLFEVLKNQPKHKNIQLSEISALLESARNEAVRLESFVASGGKILGTNGPHELGRVRHAAYPPFCMFAYGDSRLLYGRPTVGIVGTRNPSKQGKEKVFNFAKELAQYGAVVVSGGASGIDMAAHAGALAGGGYTIAVLGEPIYETQSEHLNRLRALDPQENMLIISPFGPWVSAGKSLFVIRNQYVAALSDALIVGEGKEGSGALHTAAFAYKAKIPLWAFLGASDDPLFQAPLSLLEAGQARALFRINPLLESLGLKQEPKLVMNNKKDKISSIISPVQEINSPIINAIKSNGGSMSLDDICEQLDYTISRLQHEILKLEMSGHVRRQGAAVVLSGF